MTKAKFLKMLAKMAKNKEATKVPLKKKTSGEKGDFQKPLTPTQARRVREGVDEGLSEKGIYGTSTTKYKQYKDFKKAVDKEEMDVSFVKDSKFRKETHSSDKAAKTKVDEIKEQLKKNSIVKSAGIEYKKIIKNVTEDTSKEDRIMNAFINARQYLKGKDATKLASDAEKRSTVRKTSSKFGKIMKSRAKGAQKKIKKYKDESQ